MFKKKSKLIVTQGNVDFPARQRPDFLPYKYIYVFLFEKLNSPPISPYTFLVAVASTRLDNCLRKCACGTFLQACMYFSVLKSYATFIGGNSKYCVNFTASTKTNSFLARNLLHCFVVVCVFFCLFVCLFVF